MAKAASTSRHIAHILVPHRHDAEDLLRRLDRGEAFTELARKHSTCPSSARGGDLGVVALSRLDEDFADAAAALKTGEISGVVRTKFGFHLIQILP